MSTHAARTRLQEHGDGLYSWVDGEVFGGEFVDGKPHGLGVKSWFVA
jgi:hypothetical protein